MLIYRLLNYLDGHEFKKQHARLMALGRFGRYSPTRDSTMVEVVANDKESYPVFYHYTDLDHTITTSPEADDAARQMVLAWNQRAHRICARQKLIDSVLHHIRCLLT